MTGVQRWSRTRGSIESLPRAYAQVIFAQSPWVGVLILVAGVSEPATLACGLLAVAIATLLADLLGLDAELRASGFFAYNALLVGAGMGHLHGGGVSALPMVALAAVAALALTCAARAWLTRGLFLPVLSLPFIAVFWLQIQAVPALEPSLAAGAASFSHPGLGFLAELARCLGSLFFLPSVGAGCLVGLALLLHSRIAALLAVGAFALVFSVRALLPALLPSPLFAPAAANAMLIAVATGGVWFVPSRWSVLWAVTAVLLCVFVTVGIAEPLAALGLSPLFLPFNLVSLAVLLGARERGADRNPKAVDFAAGSPEQNLRYLLEQRARFPLEHGMRFHLPFRGRWACAQGVDGEHTHRGPWRHAFDFEVQGGDGERFAGNPHDLNDYHCYRLPVLATAPGVVVKIENAVPDNPVGDMNLVHNWGNFVVLQHAPAVYSLVAHLAPGSVRVGEGQRVGQGDVLGLCGNSGRSPTPHIHFHLQNGPLPGSDTVAMSFSDVVMSLPIGERLEISHLPRKGELCRNLEPNEELAARVGLRPGDVWQLRCNGRTETIRSQLTLLGLTVLRSTTSGQLTCTKDARIQILHEVMGRQGSALSLLRIALPRLPLEENPSLVWQDYAPPLRLWRLSRWGAVASLVVPRAGLAMSYIMFREGDHLVVTGASLAKDKQGASLLRTEVVLGPHGVPLSLVVRYREREERVSGLPGDSPQPTLPLPVFGEKQSIVSIPPASKSRVGATSMDQAPFSLSKESQ